MKVYFLKTDLSQYQIFPEPQNLNDFVEIEVENESELDNKQLIQFQKQYILVAKQPTELHMWNGNEWVVDEEKQAQRLAEQQDEMWEKIKKKRYENGLGGVYIARVGKWFQTGEEEKTKYLGLDKVIDSLGEIDWKCYDNSFIKMNRTLLNEIFLQMVVDENADHINAEKHRAEMMKSAEPLNYDFSTGWSANYEEE
ncbi:DUF4376 domain-containing protein [Pasteurella multocida subsp. multocida]|uniref:DUF4376 domain-containing protein n=1 Tax=Pasteurella multocida TaxID=747 RepID=UPI00129D8017|nr:DUF4376 domain-containing protein [Pasteurella multocida]MCL7768638.1 DUF4376 domain-containing protein [Pasteurella multocida]MDA5608730.1 DUF4376 domain-containing protein [Pasteurella multocida subsp. multocida]MDA5616241.1 DUF4376 domain-containing protein [Pasteurella multocida]MDA5618027.1 DUF4376 domain-containing protein [Pasteurella multocida subsp. multocida]MDA5626291.1 DUF4376 domain-containing protein [Pasteurella multocida]